MKNVHLESTLAKKERKEISDRYNNLLKVLLSEPTRFVVRRLIPFQLTLLIVSGLSIFIALAEGIKAVLLLMVAQSFALPPEKLQEAAKIKLFGINFDLTSCVVIQDERSLYLVVFFLVMVVVFFVAAIKIFVSTRLASMEMSLLRNVRKEIVLKIFSFDLTYFSKAKSGELTYLMDREGNNFSSIVGAFMQMLICSLQMMVYIVILLQISVFLTAVFFVSSWLLMLINKKFEASVKMHSYDSTISQNMLSHMFHQVIYGIKMIKIANLEKREMDEYFHEHKNFEKNSKSIKMYSTISQAVREIGIIFVMFSVLLFSILIVESSFAVEKQTVLSFFILLLSSAPVLLGLQNSKMVVLRNYGPIVRIMRFVNQANGPDKNLIQGREDFGDQLRKNDIGCISLENVSYGYPGSSEKILEKFSANFSRGKTYVLVGHSGSGKSTLLDILSGVLTGYEGVFKFDDEELCQANKKKYKSCISYMNQEPIVFNGTLRENISYFNPSAVEHELFDSVDRALLKEFLMEAGRGLDTQLGERGLAISGGQRQRVGLARVFMQDKSVMLLDEVTNALDYQSEYEIYKNIKAIAKDKIVIVVAHRLSAVHDFDEILVMSKGVLVERGTHQELIEKKGHYYALYNYRN